MVLEYVEGGDCAALLKNTGGPLPLDLARCVRLQCDSLPKPRCDRTYVSYFFPLTYAWARTLGLFCRTFSSVQFSYSIYVSRNLIIKITTAALTSSNCVKHLSFQPARELSECQRCRLHFQRQTVPR